MQTNIKCSLPCKHIFPEGFCGKYRARMKHAAKGVIEITDKVQCIYFNGEVQAEKATP